MLEDFFFGFLERLRRFVEERIYIFEFFYESFLPLPKFARLDKGGGFLRSVVGTT